jgi:hypothetical protein
MPMSPVGTDADLVGYMSSYGIRTWTNHTESDDPGQPLANTGTDTAENALVLSQCKLFGNSFLASKLAKRYTYASLASAPMMIEVWCVIVLRTLCFRRGNPPPASLEFRYQEIVQKDGLLDQIAKGILPLTDGEGLPIRPKNANAPGWANVHVDRWYPESKVRVITGNSDMSPSALPRRRDRFPESFG